MSNEDRLFVLAASYNGLQDAEADYEAVKATYKGAETLHDFDAVIVERRHVPRGGQARAAPPSRIT